MRKTLPEVVDKEDELKKIKKKKKRRRRISEEKWTRKQKRHMAKKWESTWRSKSTDKGNYISSVQSLSCVQLCNPMNRSMPGLPVYHQLLESTQTYVHWVGDAIQPSHSLSSPSPPSLNLSQHQGLFKWARSLHQVAKVLELQHQSFPWIFCVDFL